MWHKDLRILKFVINLRADDSDEPKHDHTVLCHYSVVFDGIQPLHFKDGCCFSFHCGYVTMLISQHTTAHGIS